MKSAEKIEQLVKKIRFSPTASANKRILEHAETALKQRTDKTKSNRVELNIWRIIMNKPIIKLATAAAVILIVVLGITFLDKSMPSAYAIEQTIEANHSVRFLHIINFSPSHEEPKQWWVECDNYGQVKNLRWYMPEWDAPEDGAKVGVWKEGVAKIWFKKKKSLLIYRNKTVANWMLGFVKNHDPRLAVELLHKKAEQGQVNIDIDQPQDKSKPIIVTATYLTKGETSNRREVLYVDQATKLVTSMEFYKLRNNQYEHQCTREYHDYNIPIDSEMFALDDEVPADVMRVDQVTQDVGLAQGSLTDEEVAVEVVRQFFEALIAKDYDKAGKLFGGIPAGNIEKEYGNLNFAKIISISQPKPHPMKGVGGYVVPCEVELVDSHGNISTWKPYGPAVRPVDKHTQPNRWNLHGGI